MRISSARDYWDNRKGLVTLRYIELWKDRDGLQILKNGEREFKEIRIANPDQPVELVSKGIVVTPETIQLLNGLDEQHKEHSLRYSALMDNGKKTYLPPIDNILEMLEELLMLTRLSTQGK